MILIILTTLSILLHLKQNVSETLYSYSLPIVTFSIVAILIVIDYAIVLALSTKSGNIKSFLIESITSVAGSIEPSFIIAVPIKGWRIKKKMCTVI